MMEGSVLAKLLRPVQFTTPCEITNTMNKKNNIQSGNITLAHGNGGQLMRELIESIFVRHLANSELNTSLDAALMKFPDNANELLISTDSFTVQPLEFPGGCIGSLAVHGTVNDLAVSGARTLYMSLNVILEEGLELYLLDRIIANFATAAKEANIRIVAGDTKVVPRGECDKMYLATTGIGIRNKTLSLGMNKIKADDLIIVSGNVGDHGATIMLAREEFGLSGNISSDNANVYPLTSCISNIGGVRFMRDPTRGGLATVLHEIINFTGLGIRILEADTPVAEPVDSICEILGLNPFYLACEGRVVAVVDPEDAPRVLALWHSVEHGQNAAIIGVVESDNRNLIIESRLGGERFLEELHDEPLPRIC